MNSLKKIFLTTAIGAGVIGTPDLSIAQSTPKVDSQTNVHKRNIIQVINELPANSTYNPTVERALKQKSAVPPHWKNKTKPTESRPGLIYELETKLDNIVDSVRHFSREEDGQTYEYRAEVTTVLTRNKRPAEALLYTISVRKDSANAQPVGMARKILIEDVDGNSDIFIKSFDYSVDKLPHKSLEESIKMRGDKANRDREGDKTNSPFYYKAISANQLKTEVLRIEFLLQKGRQAYSDYKKRKQGLESAPKKK